MTYLSFVGCWLLESTSCQYLKLKASKDGYLNTYFELNYPSVDTVVNSLRTLGTGALLYKIDISRAFRHIRIDPGDLDLLGLKHEHLFIHCTLPFGFRHGSVFPALYGCHTLYHET